MQTIITPSRPMWLRIPRAVLIALGFILAVAVLFTIAPIFEITGGGQ